MRVASTTEQGCKMLRCSFILSRWNLAYRLVALCQNGTIRHTLIFTGMDDALRPCTEYALSRSASAHLALLLETVQLILFLTLDRTADILA